MADVFVYFIPALVVVFILYRVFKNKDSASGTGGVSKGDSTHKK